MLSYLEWEHSNVNVAYPFMDAGFSDTLKESFVDALVLDDTDGAQAVWLHSLTLTSTSVATIDVRYADGSAFFAGSPTYVYHTYGDWQVVKFSYATKILMLLMPVTSFPFSMSTPVQFCGRVRENDPNIVQSISVTDGVTGTPYTLQGDIVLYGGYNVELEAEDSTITLSAVAGAGLGKVPGDCSRDLLVRTINGVSPDDKGRFIIAGKDCYRTGLNPASSTLATVTMSENRLVIHNDCSQCCACEDYDNVYKALKRVHEKGKYTGNRLDRMTDDLKSAITSWELERVVRERPRMVMFLRPSNGFVLGVQLTFINNRAGTYIDMSEEPDDHLAWITIDGDTEQIENARVIYGSCYLYHSYYEDKWVHVERDDVLRTPTEEGDDQYKIVISEEADPEYDPEGSEARKQYHLINGTHYLTVFFELVFPSFRRQDVAAGTENADNPNMVKITLAQPSSKVFTPEEVELYAELLGFDEYNPEGES